VVVDDSDDEDLLEDGSDDVVAERRVLAET